MNIKIDKNWGSHIPLLMGSFLITRGPVLELGMGLYSTPFLHWLCTFEKRMLYSYESNRKYFEEINQEYADDYHIVYLVNNWDDIVFRPNYGLCLVDFNPTTKRKDIINKLINNVELFVVHDTDKRLSKKYRYEDIYPMFKYQYHYRDAVPNTSLLSNHIDVEKAVENGIINTYSC